MWPWSLESRLVRLEQRDDARTDELKKLSADLASLKSATDKFSSISAPAEHLERIESLERRFSSFHSMMTEKSPATGQERLSKAGKAFKKFFH